MTRHSTSFVLGYHGCDETVGRRAVSEGIGLELSNKDYDWLGPGVYFWENDPVRALEWAEAKAARNEVSTPFVIGAVIDLGNCFDLLLRENLQLLGVAHDALSALRQKAGLPMPENKDPPIPKRGDKLLRFLDCAVIRQLHAMIDEAEPADDAPRPFDTVRGLFVEGEAAYPGGGFYEKTHTQIAVRTDRCIKGLFLPRETAWTSPHRPPPIVS